jgi:hypothetical protein
MNDSSLQRWGGLATIGVGICSFLYGILYVVLVFLGPRTDTATSLTSFGIQITNLLLALSGFLSLIAVVTIFQKVHVTSEGWARLALWFGMFGALLGGLHGWYDLSRNPALARAFASTDTAAAANLIASLPSQVDPRGLGTFGLTALFFLILGQLLYRVEGIPQRLAQLTLVGALLLGLVFIGTVLYASGDGIAPARYLFLVAGTLQSIIVGPIVYIWLGSILRRTTTTS